MSHLTGAFWQHHARKLQRIYKGGEARALLAYCRRSKADTSPDTQVQDYLDHCIAP